jgi:hypothetical protein
MPSAIATPTFAAQNASILNDGSADSPRGWAISTNADYTFTATGPSRARCTATSANRSVNLPTTGIKAGYEAEVVTACTSPYTITVKSSNGNTVDTMIGSKGRIRCVALIDTPLASGDWEVVQVEDEGTWTPTVTSAGGSITVASSTGAYYRSGRNVNLAVTASVTNSTSGTGALRFTMPSQLSSTATRAIYGHESANTGKALSGSVSTTTLFVNFFADGTAILGTASSRFYYATVDYAI